MTCDRCIARARDTWVSPEGLQLNFCGHHSDENRAKLSEAGWLERA